LTLFPELYQIFILYFDEINRDIPLLIFPDEFIKDDEEKMRPVKFHPIWFLDAKNQKDSGHINLVYDGKVYFAKKFQIFSRKKKRRAGLREKTLDTIVVIIVLPKEMELYGSNFLNIILKFVVEDFEDLIYQIIESEILKEKLIKTPESKEIIKKGDILKLYIKNLMKNIWEDYLSSIIHFYEEH